MNNISRQKKITEKFRFCSPAYDERELLPGEPFQSREREVLRVPQVLDALWKHSCVMSKLYRVEVDSRTWSTEGRLGTPVTVLVIPTARVHIVSSSIASIYTAFPPSVIYYLRRLSSHSNIGSLTLPIIGFTCLPYKTLLEQYNDGMIK